MVTIYVDSVYIAGKTAFCASLGRRLILRGKKVGFFMPVKYSGMNGEARHSIEFLKEALELTDADDRISPMTVSTDDLWRDLTEDTQNFIQKIKKDFAAIAKNKDVMLVEGLGGMVIDNVSTLACYSVSEALDSKVIILLRYSAQLTPDLLYRVVRELGGKLLGIVVNLVPESSFQSVRCSICDRFSKAGINVLGVFPEIRGLAGVTVEELAGTLDGEMIIESKAENIIAENVMIGAMTMDSGRDYFNRKQKKAVIVRGERADMQMAALDTDTVCMVVTDNIKPLSPVIARAREKNVPVIVSPKDTAGVIADFEKAFSHACFNNAGKLNKFEKLLERYMDFSTIDPLLDQTE